MTTGNAESVQAAGVKSQNGFGEAETNKRPASGPKGSGPKRLAALILKARSVDGRATCSPADSLRLTKSTVVTITETLWSQRYDGVSTQFVLEDGVYGTAASSQPSRPSPPSPALQSSSGLLGLFALRPAAANAAARPTNLPNHDPQQQQQQQQQHQQHVFVANLGVVTSTAVAGINSSGGAGTAATTTSQTAITPSPSAGLQSPFTTNRTPIPTISTGTAIDAHDVAHAATSFQLQNLPSAPLLPPPLLPYPHVHDSPLRRLLRPRTAPAAGLKTPGASPFSAPPLPPPSGGRNATAAPPPLRDSNGALAAVVAGGGSFGTVDLQLALAPGSSSSAGGGGGGGRGTAGQGTSTGLIGRTLGDMPGLDLRGAPHYIALNEPDPAVRHTMAPRRLSAAAGSCGGFLHGGSGGSGITAAAAAVAAGMKSIGGGGEVLVGGSGGSGIAAAAASVAAVAARISGSSGGGGPATAALVAAERELGLIRVSSLSELCGQLEGLRWLASGSSGRVFTALWKGSMVAVKVVISSTQDQLRDNSREALLSRVVSHPAICQCYTVCSECITVEHLQVPRRHGQAPVPTAAGSGGGTRSRHPAACSVTIYTDPTDIVGSPLPSLTRPHMPAHMHINMHVHALTEAVPPADGSSGGADGQGSRQGWSPMKAFEMRPTAAPPPPATAAVATCEGAKPGEVAHNTLYRQQDFIAQDAVMSPDCAAAVPSALSQQPQPQQLAASDRAVPGSGSVARATSQPGTTPLPSRVALLPVSEELERLKFGRGHNFSEHSLTGLVNGETVEKGVATAEEKGVATKGLGCCSDCTAAAVGHLCGGGSSVTAGAPCKAVCSTNAAAVAGNSSSSNFPYPLEVQIVRDAGGCSGGGVAAGAYVVSSLLAWNTIPAAHGGSYTPADEDNNPATHSLPAVLLSMGAVPGRYCTIVVLEWCNQGTLLQAIRTRPFNPERSPDNHAGLLVLLRTALEIAQGMRYLHSLDIVHGDLKPSNVLLQSHVAPSSSLSAFGGSSSAVWAADMRGYVAKVADFGLAMPAHHNSGGGVLGGGGDPLGGGMEIHWGALAYLAPEVPEAGPSKKSDVYSYGCLLYHMCTGKQPFQGIRQGRLLVGLATGVLFLQWPDNIYKVLRRLGEACCSPNPRDRPSFDKVVDALQRTISYVVRSPHPNSELSRTGQAEALGSSTSTTEAEAAAEAAAAASAWRSAIVGLGQFGSASPTARGPRP
ncbi:hypothetical protein VOLCADRAFT_94879 [Volvox carteri f. nagariensis]|uniref:Protein kinase domain-containing protein n=1 Tax=Volvox carteri f. nagariensis TaxID=3068 RepID=D8U608_VOLCA|nr:uncharacterized protein VOLCADRAFT_94879 [Volvox carteri f. nagariensis]EFJ44773.1 hypothetical protein VOLCADRAFT_94879 [Volvox carteri f. nagariensis]|eukprot:XP_002954056.1 hypothetical protein VOLCADRAFT_94879 [Volvox carteri f. nagariensis]